MGRYGGHCAAGLRVALLSRKRDEAPHAQVGARPHVRLVPTKRRLVVVVVVVSVVVVVVAAAAVVGAAAAVGGVVWWW